MGDGQGYHAAQSHSMCTCVLWVNNIKRGVPQSSSRVFLAATSALVNSCMGAIATAQSLRNGRKPYFKGATAARNAVRECL